MLLRYFFEKAELEQLLDGQSILFSGYLTTVRQVADDTYELRIPNHESNCAIWKSC